VSNQFPVQNEIGFADFEIIQVLLEIGEN